MSVSATAFEYYYPERGSYNNLKIHEVQIPKPKGSEVLVKVHAVSLQFRDLAISDFRYPLAAPPHNLVPCSDMAGEVISVGEEVTGWKQGDRICSNFSTDHLYGDTTEAVQQTSLGGQTQGVLTEYRIFPAHALVKFPDHLTYEEASTLPCATLTAYNALNGPTPVKAGDYVLVLGSGGVSIAGLQLAIASGATVIATSSSDEKLKVAKSLGAKHTINYKKNSNWHEEVLKFTNGAGVDHVIEVGGYGTLDKSINCTRIGGSIHIVGFVSGGTPSDFLFPVITKAISLRGIYIGSVHQFKELNRLISANPTITKPVVDKVFPWSEAKEAFAYLESQQHVGKVVIKVGKD
ncbi:alcohol dehydrogenase superfamily protein [Pluteus cervinus]|uniref:Alcohol dehydrogenase superfamily protein n=1 Tax=Pluteus cervinus TaxID=181527 RepID=A0ACD3ADM9_9AGAR|nr:alcohol dehydrogenase superfamily protein [Pluteus cervinus]